MLAHTMRNYMTLLESTLEASPATTVHISVASPSDVLKHITTEEAASPDQVVQTHQTVKASQSAEIAAAVSKVTKVIDYLITTPTAYQKKLVQRQYLGKSATGQHLDDVLELHIPWNIEYSRDEGIYITIAGQKSPLIPTNITNTFEIIEKAYRDAGWKRVGNLDPIELRKDEMILRAYKPQS